MKKKWFKLKHSATISSDPLWAMVSLLFEALNVKIDEDRLNTLPYKIRSLFEETSPPKTLTGKQSGIIN